MTLIGDPPRTGPDTDGGQPASAQRKGSPTGSAPRRILFRLTALACAALLGLLLVEIGLRLFVPVTDVVWSFWDPVIGVRRLPGQEGEFVRPAGPRGHFSFNAQGWNYPSDFEIERPPGVVRVCVVGDSYVEAMHVGADDALALVGQQTMIAAGRPAQWYAFAQSGFGVAQCYLVLKHYVADYRPQAVIVLLVPNDLYDSSPFYISTSSIYNTVHVEADGGVRLFSARQFHPSWGRRAVYSLALGRLLFAQYQLDRQEGDLRDVSYNVFLRDERGGRLLLGEGLPKLELARRSWQHGADLMRLMRDECARMGAALLFAYCGNMPKINALYDGRPYGPPPQSADPYCMRERIWEMGADLFEPTARNLGVPYLDLTEAIVSDMQRTGERPNFGADDHYSAAGHRAAGRALAARLCALLEAQDASVRPGA